MGEQPEFIRKLGHDRTHAHQVGHRVSQHAGQIAHPKPRGDARADGGDRIGSVRDIRRRNPAFNNASGLQSSQSARVGHPAQVVNAIRGRRLAPKLVRASVGRPRDACQLAPDPALRRPLGRS